MLLGLKKIYVDIIVYPIKNLILLLKLLKCLSQKLNFYLKRQGERYASATISTHLSNKLYKYFGKKFKRLYKEFIEKIN